MVTAGARDQRRPASLLRRAGRRRALQRADKGLELRGDLCGGCVRRKGDGGADVDGEFTGAGQAAMLLFHLPNAIEAHGDNGDAEILGEEADAGLEGDHVRGVAVVDEAFGEDEEAVATIY